MSAFDAEITSFRRYLRSENKSDNTVRIYTDAAQRLARWLEDLPDSAPAEGQSVGRCGCRPHP